MEGISTDCSRDKVKIAVQNISRLFIDSVLISNTYLKMPCADGEVLTLEISEKNIFILIEWNNFFLKTSFTQSYRLYGNKIQTSVF